MSQVSKYPISASVASRIFEIFIKSLIRIKNPKQAQNLADDLFSPTEQIMLAKRLAIAFLLSKKYPYRDISKILSVSLGTIASVNLSLNNGKNGYKEILGKIEQEEQLESFFNEMVNKLVTPLSHYTKGRGAWRYLKAELQKSQTKKNSSPI